VSGLHRDLLSCGTGNLARFATLPKLDIEISQMWFVWIWVTSSNGVLNEVHHLFSQYRVGLFPTVTVIGVDFIQFITLLQVRDGFRQKLVVNSKIKVALPNIS
jgi:hypothetical protein